MLNHYKTIGTHKLATDAEIREAYFTLAKKFHPDHHENDADKAVKMANINVAYNVLKNTATRKEYDKLLSLVGKRCGECGGKAVVWKQKGFSKRVAVPCAECGGSGSAEKGA